MAQLIKTQDVKVISKEGECKIQISLDINLNLNSEAPTISVQNIETKKIQKEEEVWTIPEFTPSPRVNFGKKDQ